MNTYMMLAKDQPAFLKQVPEQVIDSLRNQVLYT